MANAILGMPTQKSIINVGNIKKNLVEFKIQINSPGKVLPPTNISQTNLKQNSTIENSKFGEKRVKINNKLNCKINKN
jgi:hypothetical protein